MKINWKLRFTNKTTLTAIILAVVTLVYQVLGLFEVVSAVSQSQVIEVAGMIINVLLLLGVITDPTTSGVSDSTQALTYDEPRKEDE